MVETGRERDPIAVFKKKLIELGELTQADGDKHQAESKGAGEVTDHDFPEEVVKYLSEGVDFAIKSPLPAAEEGGQWVFAEDNK